MLQYNKDSGIIYLFLDRLGGFPLNDTIYIYTVSIDTKETSCLGIKIPRQNKKRYREIAVNKKLGGSYPQKIVHSVYYLALV